MSFKYGRYSVSAENFTPHGICDRCGFMYAHKDLIKQPIWTGRNLTFKNILVCSRCYDKPNEQLRTILIPADPVPISNPRPIPPYDNEEDN